MTAAHLAASRPDLSAEQLWCVSGGFLRLNSWDIMHPSSLMDKIVQGSDTFSLQFTLVFFLFLFITYGLYYFCFHKKIGGTRHEDTLRQ